jgi:hypothetical protein
MEITMEKQANTNKIRKKKQGKQTMRMTTTKRKLIVCWLETDAEGGVESISWGDVRKDWQRMVGGKAGAEEIDSTLKIGEENLSEIPRTTPTQSAKQPTNQTI